MRRVARSLALVLVLLLPLQGWAFTKDEAVEATNNTTNNVLTFPAFNLAAGSMVIGGVKWEDNGASHPTISTVTDTALNTYTLRTRKDNSNAATYPKAQIFECLSTNASAVNVIVVTFSDSNAAFKRGRAEEVLTTGATFDTEAPGGEATSGTAVATGTFSTAQSVEYVFALAAGNTNETFSTPLIGGNAANFVGTSTGVDTAAFDLITGSALAGGTAAVTMSVSNRWTIVASSYKEASGTVNKRGSLIGVYP